MANTLMKRSGWLTFAGVLVLRRNEWGLARGVSIAGLSALITVFVMFVFPLLWAIAVLTLDALVVYGLLSTSDELG